MFLVVFIIIVIILSLGVGTVVGIKFYIIWRTMISQSFANPTQNRRLYPAYTLIFCEMRKQDEKKSLISLCECNVPSACDSECIWRKIAELHGALWKFQVKLQTFVRLGARTNNNRGLNLLNPNTMQSHATTTKFVSSFYVTAFAHMLHLLLYVTLGCAVVNW